MNKKVLWIVVIIIIIVAAVKWGSWNSVQEYEYLTNSENAVLIADQQPNPEQVTVHYAKLSKPGYIAVYEPGLVAGLNTLVGVSAYLPAGEYKNVPIKRIARNAPPGGTRRLVAQIKVDDGDGEFQEQEDLAVIDESGAVVESEAEVYDGANTDSLTDEELVDLLDEEGYEVDEDLLPDIDGTVDVPDGTDGDGDTAPATTTTEM